MLASRGVHVALAVMVGVATLYAGKVLSPWLFVPGGVLFPPPPELHAARAAAAERSAMRAPMDFFMMA